MLRGTFQQVLPSYKIFKIRLIFAVRFFGGHVRHFYFKISRNEHYGRR